MCPVESATVVQFSKRQSIGETRVFLYGNRTLISELSAATGLHPVRWTSWSFYAYSCVWIRGRVSCCAYAIILYNFVYTRICVYTTECTVLCSTVLGTMSLTK